MNIPIVSKPRRTFNFENWSDTTLDIFDPFDELDQELFHDVVWLRKPILRESRRKPIVPYRYRLNIDVQGYKPESIKSEIKNGKLLVSGYDEVKEGEDYSKVEFCKSFQLPNYLNDDKMICFLTKRDHLVVEIPFKKGKEIERIEEPEIKINPDGSGSVAFMLDAKNLDLNKIQVTLKDYDVIINADDVLQLGEDKTGRISKLRLPENTDIKTIKCFCDAEHLKIEARLLPECENFKKVPIYGIESEIVEEERPSQVQPSPSKHAVEQKGSPEPKHVPVETQEFLRSRSEEAKSSGQPSATAKDLIKKIQLKTTVSYPLATLDVEKLKQQEIKRVECEEAGHVSEKPKLEEHYKEPPIETETESKKEEPKKLIHEGVVESREFPEFLEAPSVVD